MVSRLTGRTSLRIFDVALDAVVRDATDVNRAALHEEELLAVDTVANSSKHIDGGVLDLEILTGFDTVLHITGDVKRTFLRELDMSLHVQTTLLLAVRGIHEGVGGAVERFDLDTLVILHMDRRTGINSRHVGQRQVIQFDGGFVTAFGVETAIARSAGERIGDLTRQVATLHDAHVCAGRRDRQVFGDISGYRDSRTRVAINDLHRTVRHFRIIDIHRRHVAEREDLLHDR